ncbi:MAG: HD domain-containing protein [Nitrospirae bacterium]|nr:HD domain-containing protein [Nitrospirota bacterium]MBF0535957.1 HD domain-containing protein [Nitrospirota bacterium]MBF0618067.1 HD domain-containing protein [Nitrospirota bacterium]
MSIGIALSAERNQEALLEMIVEKAMLFTGADGGTLYIMSEDERTLAFKIIRTKSLGFIMGGTKGSEIKFPPVQLYKEDGSRNENNVSAYVALTGKTVNIEDVYEVEGFDFQGTRAFDQKTGYRSKSMLVTAMRNHENEIIGVLQLLNATNQSGKVVSFSQRFQKLVESLASQAAIAITNSSLIRGLRVLLDSFIKVIAGAIDEKSAYTGGHIRRVAALTSTIAKGLCNSNDERWQDWVLTRDEEDELHIAAWMHDIGKITTPEYVVDKATKLETIYDRIHTVEARFELLKKQTENEFLKRKCEILCQKTEDADEKLGKLEDELNSKLEGLSNALEFIRVSNLGGEFMANEKLARLKEIASIEIEIDGKKMPILDENELHNLSIPKGTLTDDEREIINNHVVMTEKMLGGLPWPKKFKNVTTYAAEHHEKLDGSGYPHGKKAEQLSIKSRILAIADIFEALTAKDRPYRPGKKLSECVRIVGFMLKDKHLDKEIVDFFITSGLFVEYAKRELTPEQIDSFTYNGIKYDPTLPTTDDVGKDN